MTTMHDEWPQYEFARHKGYITRTHANALSTWGPCPQHRRRYVNVRRALHEVDPMGENEYAELGGSGSADEIA
jgi:ribonuclease HII